MEVANSAKSARCLSAKLALLLMQTNVQNAKLTTSYWGIMYAHFAEEATDKSPARQKLVSSVLQMDASNAQPTKTFVQDVMNYYLLQNS